MKTKTLAEIRAQRPETPERRAEIAAQRELLSAEVALHALREQRGVTQAQLADAMQISRPRVSTIENAAEDLRLSTVARYVAALGGELQVVARFENGDLVPLELAETPTSRAT